MNDAPDGSYARLNLRRSPKSLERLLKQIADGRYVTDLEVVVDDASSLERLRELPSLRALTVRGDRISDSLRLSQVQKYIGPNSVALEYWSELREVDIEVTQPQDCVVRLSGPVEVLGVSISSGTITIERLAQPLTLRWFSGGFSDQIDLSGLRDCVNVERMHFESVAHISGAHVIQQMNSLYWIGFQDVLEIEPLDGLVGVTASGGAGFAHRHPIPPDVRERMRQAEPKWSFPTDEKFYVPAGSAPSASTKTAPFEEAGDLAMELQDASDVTAMLVRTFADAKRYPGDGYHAYRAVAAAMWLLSTSPGGPTVLDGPDRDIPQLDNALRRAAHAALSAIARADAVEGRTHEAKSTDALILQLSDRPAAER